MNVWRRGVVVGVDGSDAGYRALDWAATEAVRHDARLTVLGAYVVPVTPGSVGYGVGPDDLRAQAEDVVGGALRRLAATRTRWPGSVPDPEDVDGDVVRSSAAAALVQRSCTSDLVVVGRRGLSTFDRVVLGSVSSAVSAMAAGAVAVVPGDVEAEPVWRVVAGVGRDDRAGHVLGLAFEEAERSGAPLVVVHALEQERVAGLTADELAWVQRYRDDVTTGLREEAERWSEKFPRVRWSLEVRPGPAADVLLRAADPRTVLVVGGRRHTPLAGRILGSVPDRLVRHAPCPVIVAHEQH
ncbi:universal stress protein [Isoptericola variabilis]|uniref:UspA domain-containing protein n=1 Tax=Isoptericola variabilis (strain 225) TaxID=743718 RepID=F6FV63_ISOV2|nr:universal stress protein [Isoptericola variabilis]AEG45491.1 UspA domain-containing protein [Isoptericola variabilis 225]